MHIRGKATNIVPDTCTAYAEARSLNHDKLMQIVKEMETSFQNAERNFQEAAQKSRAGKCTVLFPLQRIIRQ